MTTNTVAERKPARTPANHPAEAFQRPENDRFGALFEATNLVPEEFRGTDRYLDVVTWNIRYFHDRDPKRVLEIAEIMSEINADLFVLQEIQEGSLEGVIHELASRGAGFYEAAYGTTGGSQRLAFLYDLDWLRTTDDVAELFDKGEVTTPEGKDAFPRLPLWGAFTCLPPRGTEGEPFDFQMVGLHLKSQRSASEDLDQGHDQRALAAEALADWLKREAPKSDADVILLGDWNQTPSAPEWAAFHQLERQGKAAFRRVNDDSAISHLMYRNRQEFGSRLDLEALSLSALGQVSGRAAQVIRWKPLDQVAEEGGAKRLASFIRELGAKVSDHMPALTRFYFTQR